MKKLIFLMVALATSCATGFGQVGAPPPATTPLTRTFLKAADAEAARSALGILTTNASVVAAVGIADHLSTNAGVLQLKEGATLPAMDAGSLYGLNPTNLNGTNLIAGSVGTNALSPEAIAWINAKAGTGGSLDNPMDGYAISNAPYLDTALFSVNGRRFGLAESNNLASSVSITLGSPSNYIASGAYASVIGGGGETGTDDSYTNAIHSRHSTVAGGVGNHIGTEATGSTIGGGELNSINKDSGVLDSSYSTIAGGEVNKIMEDTRDGFIGGGYRNIIGESSIAATIAGGYLNSATGAYSSILGGYLNKVTADRGVAIGSYLTNTTDGSVMLGYGLSRVSFLTNNTVAWMPFTTNSANHLFYWNAASTLGITADGDDFSYTVKDLVNSDTVLFGTYGDSHANNFDGGRTFLLNPYANGANLTNIPFSGLQQLPVTNNQASVAFGTIGANELNISAQSTLTTSGAVINGVAFTNGVMTADEIQADTIQGVAVGGNGSGLTNGSGFHFADTNWVSTNVFAKAWRTNANNTGAIAMGQAMITNLAGNITISGFSGVDLTLWQNANLVVTNSSADTTYKVTFPAGVGVATNTFCIGQDVFVTNKTKVIIAVATGFGATNVAAVRFPPQ
jgi:hypothetical protein